MSNVVPTTGPGSVSFRVHLTAVLLGIVSTVVGLVDHGQTAQTWSLCGGGILTVVLSTLAKLAHDRGIHVAAIAAAGADLAKHLPQLEADLAAVQRFLQTDWPGASVFLTQAEAKLSELEAQVQAIPGADVLFQQVLAQVRAALAGQPPPTPATGGSAP